LDEIVYYKLKIIIYLGPQYIGVELAKQAYDKELYGKHYA